MDAVRQNEIIFQRGAGKTLAEIGKSYGISRQRVAQIVGKTGYIPRHPCPTTKLVRQLTAFLRNIEVRGECWIWQGYVHPNGYGVFCNTYAHRWAYETYNGEIPDGLNVCHTCDRQRCCNPSHLYAGTRYHTHASTVYNAIHRPDCNAREK